MTRKKTIIVFVSTMIKRIPVLVLLSIFTFSPLTIEAFTTGPNTAGTITEAGVTGCTNNASTWSTTASVYATNDSTVSTYGSATNWDATETSDEVRLANFGFSITGTVTGITVEVLGWESLSGTANYTDVILFTTAGTEVGSDKATGALPTADPGTTYQTFGGSADTWTAGLTAAQVSASSYGVVLCWTAGSANSQVSLDHVRMTIEYTNSAPTLSIAQPDGTSDTVSVGSSYNITYTSADTDNVVTTAFFYDTNNSGLDGTTISGACATAAEGTNATCSWDTTGVTPGSYYVYGTTNDGVNAVTSAYSSGQITISANPPTVTTNAETNVTLSSATMNGEITVTGGQNSTARGLAWGTNSTLTNGDTSTTTESGDFGLSTFSQNVSNLKAATTYYFRAYATNPAGTGYGAIDNLVTSAASASQTRKLRLFSGQKVILMNGRVILQKQ